MRVDNTDGVMQPQKNSEGWTDYSRYTAKNCQKNPVSAHIHTEATARDMDLMRHFARDEKLHYYGISYGTWLGFGMPVFSLRGRLMVIDSSMNFNQSHDASILSKEVSLILNHQCLIGQAPSAVLAWVRR